MFTNRVAPMLALLLMLFAQTARAFFDPPYMTPAAPVAGEMVGVNIRGGICDGIVGTPGYPQITQNGNAIRFLVFGVRTQDIDYCNYPVGTATFPVGAYPSDSPLQPWESSRSRLLGRPHRPCRRQRTARSHCWLYSSSLRPWLYGCCEAAALNCCS